MSGETPMSAFRASLSLYDSYWREFPRKRQMPSAQQPKMTALPVRIQSVDVDKSCVMCDERKQTNINWCLTLLTRQEIQ